MYNTQSKLSELKASGDEESRYLRDTNPTQARGIPSSSFAKRVNQSQSAFDYIHNSVQNQNDEFPSLGQGNLSNFRSPDSRGPGAIERDVFRESASSNFLRRENLDRRYVGLINKNLDDRTSNEFMIQKEDFPALGGAIGSNNPSQQNSGNQQMPAKNIVNEFQNQQAAIDQALQADLLSRSLRKEHQSSPGQHGQGAQHGYLGRQKHVQLDIISNMQKKQDNFERILNSGELCMDSNGVWHNVPKKLIRNKFGLLGLLKGTTVPDDCKVLTYGLDLLSLGLPLDKKDPITEKFGGPFADMQCRPQDIDYIVPGEYLTNDKINEKLHPIELDFLKDDVIFMLYYTNPRDVLSMACAQELYSKGWRYHKIEQRWLKRANSESEAIRNQEGVAVGERATFEIFDPDKWQTLRRENWELRYEDLEGGELLQPNHIEHFKQQQAYVQQQRIQNMQNFQMRHYQQTNTAHHQNPTAMASYQNQVQSSVGHSGSHSPYI